LTGRRIREAPDVKSNKNKKNMNGGKNEDKKTQAKNDFKQKNGC
jgi:hypothetical protein